MKHIVKFFFGILFLISFSAYSQSPVVNIPDLEGKYTGDLKKGLAHGVGEAIGKDNYKGEFKKGLPHGEGTYTWNSGEVYIGNWKKGKRNGLGKLTFNFDGKDSVLQGYWLEDKFIGDKPRPEADYKIIETRGIERVRIIKLSDEGEQIVIKLMARGKSPYDYSTTGTSGFYSDESIQQRYEDVEFPFEGTVRYQIPSLVGTGLLDCYLRYKINSPGTWEIQMVN